MAYRPIETRLGKMGSRRRKGLTLPYQIGILHQFSGHLYSLLHKGSCDREDPYPQILCFWDVRRRPPGRGRGESERVGNQALFRCGWNPRRGPMVGESIGFRSFRTPCPPSNPIRWRVFYWLYDVKGFSRRPLWGIRKACQDRGIEISCANRTFSAPDGTSNGTVVLTRSGESGSRKGAKAQVLQCRADPSRAVPGSTNRRVADGSDR